MEEADLGHQWQSGSSPIYFRDRDALTNLAPVADFFVTNNRNIVVPQDDSVIQFSPVARQRIVIRRSRVMHPRSCHIHDWSHRHSTGHGR